MSWKLFFKIRKKRKNELAQALITLYEFFRAIDGHLLLTGLDKKRFWLRFIEDSSFSSEVLSYLIEDKDINKLVRKVLKIKI